MPVSSYRKFFIFPFKISSQDFCTRFCSVLALNGSIARGFSCSQSELGLASTSIFPAAESFLSGQFGLGHRRFWASLLQVFTPPLQIFPGQITAGSGLGSLRCLRFLARADLSCCCPSFCRCRSLIAALPDLDSSLCQVCSWLLSQFWFRASVTKFGGQ
jgi:hypothetical protein